MQYIAAGIAILLATFFGVAVVRTYFSESARQGIEAQKAMLESQQPDNYIMKVLSAMSVSSCITAAFLRVE